MSACAVFGARRSRQTQGPRGNHGDSPVLVVLLVGQSSFGSRTSTGCLRNFNRSFDKAAWRTRKASSSFFQAALSRRKASFVVVGPPRPVRPALFLSFPPPFSPARPPFFLIHPS